MLFFGSVDRGLGYGDKGAEAEIEGRAGERGGSGVTAGRSGGGVISIIW